MIWLYHPIKCAASTAAPCDPSWHIVSCVNVITTTPGCNATLGEKSIIQSNATAQNGTGHPKRNYSVTLRHYSLCCWANLFYLDFLRWDCFECANTPTSYCDPKRSHRICFESFENEMNCTAKFQSDWTTLIPAPMKDLSSWGSVANGFRGSIFRVRRHNHQNNIFFASFHHVIKSIASLTKGTRHLR